MSKISILTTTYNHQDFIGYTIQSILDQSIIDWELLIGDDSPGKETWKIIQSYREKYPEKIQARHHTPNKGIVENTNFLISKIAKESKYIAFLEGDDMRGKDYLKEKLAIFDKYPEVKLVYNNLDFIDDKNKTIQKNIFRFRKIKTYRNEKIPCDEMASASIGPILSWSTGMISKDIIEKHSARSLNTTNKGYSISDYDFYFQIAKDNKVYFIDKPLTHYRRHKTNLSGSNPKVMEELSHLMEVYYKQGLITKTTYYKKISHNNIVQSLIYIESGDKKKSLNHWKKALRYNRSNQIIMKGGVLCLVCLPKKRSKRILEKLIKRG